MADAGTANFSTDVRTFLPCGFFGCTAKYISGAIGFIHFFADRLLAGCALILGVVGSHCALEKMKFPGVLLLF